MSELQELLDQLRLSLRVNQSVAAILEEYQQRLYNLEQDNKLLLASFGKLNERCASLEKRYSELLYKLSELRKK